MPELPGRRHRHRSSHWLLFLLQALLSCAALAQAPPPQTAPREPLPEATLIRTLRQGGCVLLMRHASSPAALPGKDAEPDNPAHERQLDATGRSTARAMGEALRALRIPVGRVLSSPTYRTRETVRLAALGTPEIAAQLDAAAADMAHADEDAARAKWLRDQVTAAPLAGANTVIVTHSTNILGAFREQAADPHEGEAFVFRPDGAGGAALIARVRIEDWPRLSVTSGASSP